MKLSGAKIEHIATLARIHLSDEEKERFASQLSQVLEYMDILNEVDTTNVPPTAQVTGLSDVFRADRVREQEPGVRQALISAFPDKAGDLLKVHPVFGYNSE